MRRVVRKHRRDFLAILGLVAVALAVGGYILANQRLRFPLLEPKPFEVRAAFATAQAVTPGQGQTVRVAGVRGGGISGADLVDGRAVITLQLDDQYRNLVHTDARALLRPKTGLKDMFVELDPGTERAPPAKRGWTLPIASTLPDVNPDEVLAGLDADTRDYLRLLLKGAGQGLDGRGGDLRAVLRRFEPTYRDLAAVSGEVRKRRVELRRLVHSLDRLNAALGGKDEDLAQLVDSAARVFSTLASERRNVAATVHELPGTLRQATSTLGRVEAMARQLGPTTERMRPVMGALRQANARTLPFALAAAPQLRADIRPFVRETRPLARELLGGVRGLASGAPGLTRSFAVLNRFFNMLAANPRGREGPEVAGRDEGYLFYLGWLSHMTDNLFGNSDAHGDGRPITSGGTCDTLRGSVHDQPELEELLGLTGALTDPRVCGTPNG